MKKEEESSGSVFASNLNKALKRRGLSQKALAEKCGGEPSAKTVNNIVRGVHSPTIETAEVLCSMLGYKVWQMLIPSLFDGDGDLAKEKTLKDLDALFEKEIEPEVLRIIRDSISVLQKSRK